MAGTPKISMFVIALIWISFFTVTFATYITNLSTSYGVEFDESEVETFNKMAELEAQAKQIQDDSNIEEDSSLLDVIGGYFSAAYTSLRATASSFSIFESMAKDSLESDYIALPNIQILMSAIITTVLILIFVGIIMAAIVKRDL